MTEKYIKFYRNSQAEDSIRAMMEGQDSIFFYATHDNLISYSHTEIPVIGWSPFVFPPNEKFYDRVSTLYIDHHKHLYIGTHADNFYVIKKGADMESLKKSQVEIIDSTVVITKGEMPVNKITILPRLGVFSFAQDKADKNIIWIGTSKGLFRYNNETGKINAVEPLNQKGVFTVTHIETDHQNNLWFSTLEKGMGFYYREKNTINFFPYRKKKTNSNTLYPIKTFCFKSAHEIFVAVMDSLPAVFNKKNGMYTFINDPSFEETSNTTTDIKVDRLGNLFLIKGGSVYVCKASESSMLKTAIKPDSILLAPFVSSVVLNNGVEVASINYQPEQLKELRLKHDQNSFIIYYDLNDFGDKSKIQFAWKMGGYTDTWVVMPNWNSDSANIAFANKLNPGQYVFELKVKVGEEDWRTQQAKMVIIIAPPYWKTLWFWIMVVSGFGLIVSGLFWWRIRAVRRHERERFTHEKQILELEAKALRAQMNPHFIFNSLNSIKSLIQQHEEEKSVNYLTTFSKLIRTLLNNADKKEISLYDEIETCKLYLQLEAMRFDTKFSYAVDVDNDIDLKSIQVPALIIQPFIENAIWHGIVPRNSTGHVSLNVVRKEGVIEVIIDDDGIGREASQQNKSNSRLAHQSKGVNLTQTRLELNNLLQQRQAALEIIDKKDETGMARGTTVNLKFKESE